MNLLDTTINIFESDSKNEIDKEIRSTQPSTESKKDEAVIPPINIGNVSLLDHQSSTKENIEIKISPLVQNNDIKLDPNNDNLLNVDDILDESPKIQKEKEDHLKNLGLLTLQAAKDEKRRKDEKKSEYFEEIYDSSSNSKFENEYTGTLKTVIKLNRPVISSNIDCESNKKKTQGNNIMQARQSLKMTFQKGKVRNTNIDKKNPVSEEDYYTIQNEVSSIYTR